jgi:hypothetical protein
MRLRSTDGASVELHITGHEFPDHRVPVVEVAINWLQAGPTASQLPNADAEDLLRDWDANWLQVSGSITLADGRIWAFEDPCLATWQARELAEFPER